MAGGESNRGWVALHRTLREHWLWADRPFSRGQAWVDLILAANHRAQKILFNGQLLTVERGSTLTSIRKLSEHWGWSQGKVRRFLDGCKTDGMVAEERSGNGTILTLVNYGRYQDPPGGENSSPQGMGDGAPTAHRLGTGQAPMGERRGTDGIPAGDCQRADTTPAGTNNKGDNGKNGKNENQENHGNQRGPGPTPAPPGEAPPTVEEVTAYCRERNSPVDPQRFVQVCTAKGWMLGNTPIRDWRAYLRSWEAGELPKAKPKDDRSFESSSFDARALQDRLLADFMAAPLPGEAVAYPPTE